MTQQTFHVEREARVVIAQLQGDLQVRMWREQAILVETDDSIGGIQQEGNTLTMVDGQSDLKLTMPYDASLRAANIDADVQIEGIRLVELENVSGDVSLREIGGNAGLENIGEGVELTNLGSDLSVVHTPVLRIRQSVGGDATVKNVQEVEIETVGGDLNVENAQSVLVNTLGGSLQAENVALVLRCRTIGGDCQVQGSAQTEVVVGTVAGDYEVSGAASVHTGNIGGDCTVSDVTDDVEIGYVGGDASCKGVGGNVQAGHVGGDGVFLGIQGSVEVGSIGGDLELQANLPAETRTRLIVGGDAKITLPENASVSMRATVGGDVSGRGIHTGRGGNIIKLVYGEGAAHLDMNVGGDLVLRGSDAPRSASTMGGGSWNVNVDVDIDDPEHMKGGSWSDFGHEMAQFGRDLSKMGEELGRELAAAFSEAGWSHGADFAHNMGQKAEERARQAQRKAEEQARQAQQKAEERARQAQQKAEERARQAQRKAEEQARRTQEKAGRMNIRFNEREWRLDPERLERIREQARRAANEGVTGAFEAVERAMSNLGLPIRPATPPPPPMPPTPPSGPSMPAAAGPGMPPVPPMPPDSSAPMAFVQSQPASNGDGQADKQEGERDVEQEREAILRMIAEGRVTPEEGDLLLEALGE